MGIDWECHLSYRHEFLMTTYYAGHQLQLKVDIMSMQLFRIISLLICVLLIWICITNYYKFLLHGHRTKSTLSDVGFKITNNKINSSHVTNRKENGSVISLVQNRHKDVSILQ